MLEAKQMCEHLEKALPTHGAHIVAVATILVSLHFIDEIQTWDKNNKKNSPSNSAKNIFLALKLNSLRLSGANHFKPSMDN